MSLTTAQHDLLVKYLKGLEIKTQEPFEEFYDHIATAIEKEQPDDINEFLREVIQPSFGGVKGIKRILLNQGKMRSKLIWQRAKEIFLSLFGWPAIGIVIVSLILVQTSLTQFGTKFTILITLSLGLLLPLFVVAYGFISFSRDCKKSNKDYHSSDLNQTLLVYVNVPFALLNILGNLVVPIFYGREDFKLFLDGNIWLNTLLCAFALLYGFTCLKLLKENFTFKVELK